MGLTFSMVSIVAIYRYNELRHITTSTEQIHVADGNIAEELTSFMTAYYKRLFYRLWLTDIDAKTGNEAPNLLIYMLRTIYFME